MDPVAPPPAAANLGANPATRGAKDRKRLETGLNRRRMFAEDVFQRVEAAKLAP